MQQGAIMQGLATAQRQYDRMSPEDEMTEEEAREAEEDAADAQRMMRDD